MQRRAFLKKVALSNLLIAFGGGFSCNQALARIPGTVTWGGVYPLGNKNSLPHVTGALSLATDEGITFNNLMLSELREINWSIASVDLRTGLKRKLTRYGLVMAFAYERVLTDLYSPKLDATQFDLRLIAYTILYDVEDRKVIAAFANRYRFFDSRPGDTTSNDLASLYFDLMINDDGALNLPKQAAKDISDFPFALKYRGKTFKVTSITGSKFAEEGASALGMGLMPYYDDIGFVATCAFSEKLLSPVIPYEKTRALTTDLIGEMKIIATDGEGPLNTSLPLPEPEVAISIFHDGWDFKEKSLSEQRTQVTLATSFTISFTDQESATLLYSQGFFGQQDFVEIDSIGYKISRGARIYRMHEALLDRALLSIADPATRGALFDGINVKNESEHTFLQAVEEDWDHFTSQNETIYSLLPRAFGE